MTGERHSQPTENPYKASAREVESEPARVVKEVPWSGTAHFLTSAIGAALATAIYWMYRELGGTRFYIAMFLSTTFGFSIAQLFVLWRFKAVCMSKRRPTLEDTARLISALIGGIMVIVASWRNLPDAISAAGLGVMFFGAAHTSFSSSDAVLVEKRAVYTLVGLLWAAFSIALACYVAWELMNSFAWTVVVLATAAILHCAAYFASRACFRKLYGSGNGSRGATITER